MVTRRRLAWLLVVVLVCAAAGGVLVLQLTGHGPQVLLARYLAGYLRSVPDERVSDELQQLAQLDRLGVLVLVDALGNERASVATSAVAALDSQLARWRALPRDESSGRVGELARNLALRVDQWPPRARSAAGDLALQILDWPIDGRHVDRAALIADCEHVLRARGTDVKATTAVPARPDRHEGTVPADMGSPAESSPRPLVDLSASLIPASSVPGGSLPVEESELPGQLPSPTAIAEPRLLGRREPSLLPTPRAPRTAAGDDPDQESTRPGTLSEHLPRDGGSSDANRSSIRPLSSDLPLPPDAGLQQLPDRTLFAYLEGGDAEHAAQAEQILVQRGYRALDLTLARKLTSPQVAERRQLVETVARLPHGAGRWLVWLSQDPDPGVRETAVSLMVTAQDPRVLRRLLEMETEEVDEGIREQLRKWRESRR